MPVFQFVKTVDCGALHRLLVQNGFDVVGVTFDSGTNLTTVQLADTETKDPTAVVEEYIFVPYVPINWTQLYSDAVATVVSAQNTVDTAKGILQDDLALYNSANTKLQNAQSQYNTAAGQYITALNAWNSAANPTNLSQAVAKLNIAESQIQALASACQALLAAMQTQAEINSVFLSAFTQIVSVLNALEAVNDAENSVIDVLARHASILEEE